VSKVPHHFFDQSAVVPFQWRDGALEVLLISSRKKKRWVIPKGVKELGLSAQESAAKEAIEEAGIEGGVLPEAIGSYEYRKWGGVCCVEVFAMAVEKVHDEWLESYRDREWLSVDEACQRVEEVDLKRLIGLVPEFARGHVV
jgi:8-oxo-dGTP pyrophosphatase MutT (NUDIX family)